MAAPNLSPAQRNVLMLADSRRTWRTPRGGTWFGPPNDPACPISEGDYTETVRELFDAGFLIGEGASDGTGSLAVLTDAGRALLDALNAERPQ